MGDEHLWEIYDELSGMIQGWVSTIDSKARFILTLNLAFLGVFLTQMRSFITALKISFLESSPWSNLVAVAFVVAFLIYIMLGGASIIYLVRIIYPKLKPFAGRQSRFHFPTIAQMDPAEFKEWMSSITLEESLDELADQVFNDADYVQREFRQLQRSILFMEWATLPWLLIFLGLALFHTLKLGS